MELGLSKLAEVLLEKIEAWVVALVQMLPNFILATFVFLLFWYFGKVLRSWLDHFLRRFHQHQTLTNLATGVIFTGTVALGLFIALGILNLDKTVTSLLAGAGVIGLALGFAFQEIASNFLSGILLAFERPFRVGDIISVKDHIGNVKQINLRTTVIRAFDGLEVQVPNKNMYTEVLSNYTSTPDRRVDLVVGVSYGEDLRRVEKVVRGALEAVPHRIVGRPVEVYFQEFGDSSINFEARVWIQYPEHRYYLEALHETVILIKEAFDENDITIPFPIRTLDFGIKGGVRMSEELKGQENE